MGKIITIILFALFQVTAIAKPSVWLYNQTADKIVLAENANVVRPFASLTKLMTAMIALDHDQTMSRQLKLDRSVGSRLPPNSYTRRELFDAMLVRSDNAAAETLAADYPGGRKGFIKEMNHRAQQLGMLSAHFDDPTGLSRNNRATAGEIGTMMQAASKYEFIREVSVQRQVMIESHHKQRIRIISLENTNRPILFTFDNIDVSKTGFTNPAGWCVGLRVKKNNQNWIVVILGAQNKAHRIDLVQSLMYNHIIDSEILNHQPHEPGKKSWNPFFNLF